MTTVKVHGRTMIFSEEELKFVLESYFAPTPQPGRWFEVNPLAIDQEIFDFTRKDKKQEMVRQYILDAFVEVVNNPKYESPFYTYIPVKDWEDRTYEEFKAMASQKGGHIATWVHQALEWAQRIANGESWESICNEPDKSKWYRLVKWKKDDFWLVGSAELEDLNFPVADVLVRQKDSDLEKFHMEVPLIVKYK